MRELLYLLLSLTFLLLAFVIWIVFHNIKQTYLPVRIYTKGLISIPERKLCDYEFIEYENRTEVRVVHCVTVTREMIEELMDRFGYS